MTILIGHVDPRLLKKSQSRSWWKFWSRHSVVDHDDNDHCNQEGVDIHDEQHSDGTNHIIWEKNKIWYACIFLQEQDHLLHSQMSISKPRYKKKSQEKNKQKKTFSPSLLSTWLRVDCMADNFAFFIWSHRSGVTQIYRIEWDISHQNQSPWLIRARAEP